MVLREAQRKEGLHSAFVVILWSKDRVLAVWWLAAARQGILAR